MNAVKRLGIFIVTFGLLSSFGIAGALANREACGIGEKAVEGKTACASKTFHARVVCLGCTLKKEQGAKAQCSAYGHKHALRTNDSRIWTILENDASRELTSSHEYVGKDIEVTGKKYPDAQVVEIETFKILGE